MNIGPAFGEHIKTEKLSRRNHEDSHQFSMRSFFLPIILVLIFTVLFLKLISIQIVKGSYFRDLSDSNRIRTYIIHAPRGVIFDRNNIPLVFNAPGFRQTAGDKTILLSHDEAVAKIAKGEKYIEVDSLRQYPYKEVFAHILGYIGQMTKDELSTREFADYQLNDLVGKSGIEEQYEHTLRGTDGKQLVEVNAVGKITRTLGQTDPIPGQDITLTIDSKLQQTTFDAMKDVKKGAAIVSTPNGEILAMISKPVFDSNLFTLDKTYKVATDSAYQSITSILNDSQNQPLLNRAISGIYPPGSAFKIVTAVSGLQNGIIDESYMVVDSGILTVGEFSFANWFYTEYGKKESGELNVVRALARSNDIFFYKLAEKIGVDKLSQTAESFGLGNRLGIDLPGEQKGTVPTDAWKKKIIGEPWYLGDTYHYGIGQGYLLTTPLQVNAWTEVIANGGTLYQPQLFKNNKQQTIRGKLLSEKNQSLVRQGMIDACSTGGVAWPLFNFKVKNEKLKIDGENILDVPEATTAANLKDYRHVVVACKTGTAQHGTDETLPHAWITLFAPAYNPQIVLTVLSESSGEGSNVASPIAKKILEDYFSRK